MGKAMIGEELGGVRAVRVEWDSPFVLLMFRGGWADESLRMRGIAHMAEHLALSPFRLQPYDYNGFVDPVRTVFSVSGSTDDVQFHLSELCRRLRELPMERLSAERRILQAEAAGRPAPPVNVALSVRFGLRGHGLAAAPEFGLAHAGEAAVSAWASSRFTRGNAAIVVAGALNDLQLDLPAGRLHPTSPPPPPVVPLPGWMHWPGVLMLSSVMPRTPASAVGLRVVETALMEELRYRRAVSYAVQSNYLPLNGEYAHVAAMADLVVESTDEAIEGWFEVLERLGRDGIEKSQLVDAREFLRRTMKGPFSPLARAESAAMDALLGRPSQEPDAVDEELDSLDVSTLNEALGRLLGGGLVFAPTPHGRVERWGEQVPKWSPRRVEGRSLKPERWRNEWKPRRHPRLLVGRAGLTLETDDQRFTTVAFDTCVGLAAWRDGRRTLYGADGTVVDFDPLAWEGGEDVRREIDERLTDVAIPIDETHGPDPELVNYLKRKTPRSALLFSLWWGLLVVGGVANVVSPDPDDYESGDLGLYILFIVVSFILALYCGRLYVARRRWRRSVDAATDGPETESTTEWPAWS